jgi:hypothetical protein
MSINIIIFSLNRPAQLELLLRSHEKYFKEWKEANTTIIYKATNKEFQNGYDKLILMHPEFNYVRETNFQQNVIEGIDVVLPYTQFLVDDIVFKNNWSLKDKIFSLLPDNYYMLAISLRLHRGINYCYAMNKPSLVPQFKKEMKDEYLVWEWRGTEGDWGYSASIDGNIYQTSLIRNVLSQIQFNNPNKLEAILNNPQVTNQAPQYITCYDGPSKLLNIPANKVQNVFNNRCENNWTIEELNKKFLNGQIISLENIEIITDNNTVHFPVEYKFKE